MSTTPPAQLEALCVTAILGTDHASSGSLDPSVLLTRVSVASTRARAGRVFHAEVNGIPPCPLDPRPITTPRQTSFLEALLRKPDAEVILEWCTYIDSKGLRVPPMLVPVLLDWWSNQPKRSPLVFKTTGSCGVWLASLNPDWGKAAAQSLPPSNPEDLWQNGTTNERAIALEQIRAKDTSRAVDLVRTTWSTDGTEERKKWISILAETATPSDEPFFEAALDDASVVVRATAAQALTSLPNSAYRQRMRARAVSMITVEKITPSKQGAPAVKLTVEPPLEFDPAWKREGLEQKAAGGRGRRAHWLFQILAATNLSMWTDLTGLSPAEFLIALDGLEFRDEIIDSLRSSAKLCPVQPCVLEWSDAIIRKHANKSERERWRPYTSLWPLLPVQQSEAARLQFVQFADTEDPFILWLIFLSDPRSWTLEYSNNVLAVLRAKDTKSKAFGLGIEFDAFARRVHPAAALAFHSHIETRYEYVESGDMKRCLDRLQLRSEMYTEFHS